LQVNYAPSSKFELVGQALVTRRVPYDNLADNISWAFAAYRPNSDLTLRVGRVNLDLYLLSDYRNVGFGYMFARPPVEFYGSLPSTLDGADVAQVWTLGGTRLRGKIFAGRTKYEDVQIRPAVGGMISDEANGLVVRAGYTHVAVSTNSPELQPLVNALGTVQGLDLPGVSAQAGATRSAFEFAGDPINYGALGISYEMDDWQWSGEFTRLYGSAAAQYGEGYVAAGRRLGAFTVFGVASRIRSFLSPSAAPAWGAAAEPYVGPALAQQIQGVGAAAAFAANLALANQHTLALGTRWDIHPRVALKFQWDHVWIDANGGGHLWANSTGSTGHANIGTILLDFVF
jgi:hypothetical protein